MDVEYVTLHNICIFFPPLVCLSHAIKHSNNFQTINAISCFAIGGCFIEGQTLRNAFRWKDSVGPWEQRPGHFGDVWSYWTDDGLGYFEGLQVGPLIYIFFFVFVVKFDHMVLNFPCVASGGHWCKASVGL